MTKELNPALLPFQEGGRWWGTEHPDHPGLVTDIYALEEALIEAERALDDERVVVQLLKRKLDQVQDECLRLQSLNTRLGRAGRRKQ